MWSTTSGIDIRVGSGKVGTSELVRWHDTNIDRKIHAISVDTKDVRGNWIFKDTAGMCDNGHGLRIWIFLLIIKGKS